MTIRNQISTIADRVISGEVLDAAEALKLADVSGLDLNFLFAEASRIREHYKGSAASLCSIINAKSGRCPENCAFCAQSAVHDTNAPVYPLVDEEQLVSCAKGAEQNGALCYGIITSGTGIGPGQELQTICNALRRIRRETAIEPSCSLGILDVETALVLKEAGMVTYHHNLETARSFFPNICSTHDYEEDVNTVRAVKQAGLRVCCGGIFGLGENFAQRIEMAVTLRELDVDTVPINFLNPVAGTRLADANFLTPMECLKIIAIYRFMMPAKSLTVCGGREKNLRELQSWIFLAGASGMMTGNYLTTPGRAPEQDHQMLKDLELSVESCS
ncbi:MAG: biotin synthase BioB [Deltaproteobacteria bacterium]|nr:biotin synthase BioB [Deltaproteobacteria bacterium]